MNKIIPLIAFVLFSLIDFYGIYLEKQLMVNFAKPMLMITLFWYYYSNTKQLNKYFVLGLFFSFLGDLLLLGTGEVYFIFGLLFFLIAHVFYIIMVLRLIPARKPKNFIMASVPFLLLFLILMNILFIEVFQEQWSSISITGRHSPVWILLIGSRLVLSSDITNYVW